MTVSSIETYLAILYIFRSNVSIYEQEDGRISLLGTYKNHEDKYFSVLTHPILYAFLQSL